MNYCNYRRMHQGYKMIGNDCRIPVEVHLQKNLTSNRESANVKR